MAVSIVDYMKSQKMDSSYAARKKLAEQQGISGYSGTAAQNIKLYNNLKNGATGSTSNATASGTANTPSANVTAGMSSSSSSSSTTRGYTPGQSVTEAYKAMKAREAYMPGDYEESENVERYRDKLHDVEDSRPADFKSQYSEQINNILNNIYGDKGFSYTANDMQNDELYKMYAQQYQQSAQRAMRDTMGNAAALTGGYGSTAAQTAGQQVYDQQMSGLNDRALDFYDRAYQRYADDRANRYNQLGAFQSQDNTDYSRYRDKVSDWQTDRNYYAGMLGQEQSNDLNIYNANAANYWNGQNYLAGRYDSALGADFSQYQQDQSDSQWQKSYDMQKEAQDLDNEYKRLQMAQLQQSMALRAAGGSGSGKGGGKDQKKKDQKQKPQSIAEMLPYTSSQQLLDDYLKIANTEGTERANKYKQYMQDNHKVNYTDGIQEYFRRKVLG